MRVREWQGNSLSLSLLDCHRKRYTLASQVGDGLNDISYVNHLVKCLTLNKCSKYCGHDYYIAVISMFLSVLLDHGVPQEPTIVLFTFVSLTSDAVPGTQ